MVTKSKKKATGAKAQKKGRVKVGKLQVNRETIKDLSDEEARRVRGGIGPDLGVKVVKIKVTCIPDDDHPILSCKG